MPVLRSRDLSQRLSRSRFIFVGGLVMLAGLGARYVSHAFMAKGEVSHIVAEIGMAMIVAAVVTILYEVNARAEFTGHTMSHVLRTVIGDMFDTELWEELRRQLLEQRAIRRQFSVRIRLTRVAELVQPRAVLQMTTSYRVYALHPSQSTIRMLHYLDDFMRDERANLPRYEMFSIGGKLIQLGTSQRYDDTVDLSKHPKGLEVVVERKEIVYVPGAYNLTLTALTSVENIQVLELPQDCQIQVNWLEDSQTFDAAGGCAVNRMLLPGHSIELTFRRRGVPPVSSGTA